MSKLRLYVNEVDYLERALDFVGDCLDKYRVGSKEKIKATLLTEEMIVLLQRYAKSDAPLIVGVEKTFGDVNVLVSMEGSSFDPELTVEAITEGMEDDEAEEAIRNILVKANGERIKYRHVREVNKVRIQVDKSGASALYRTLLALAMGVVFGLILSYFAPRTVSQGIITYLLKPVKSMFMSALSIVIAPVVFFSIVTCVSGFKNLSELGKMAGKVMMVYVATTVMAILLGITTFNLINPGSYGFALGSEVAATDIAVPDASTFSPLNTIMDIVPSNFLAPFVASNTLQVIFLAVIVGVAVGMIGEYSSVLMGLFEACNSLFLTITTLIAKFIPIAVFCSVAIMMSELGGASFLNVLSGCGVEIMTIGCMILVYGIPVLLLARLNPLQFYKNAREGMLTSFSLSSSSAAMPVNMRVCTDKMGISPKVANFSIPLGATINMDGTSIYMSTMTLFLAKAYGIEISGTILISIVITIVLLSLGAPGVPGGGLVCLGVVLTQAGVPIEALGLIIAVNPLMDMCNTMNNVTGDMMAALLIAKSEKLLDESKFYAKNT